MKKFIIRNKLILNRKKLMLMIMTAEIVRKHIKERCLGEFKNHIDSKRSRNPKESEMPFFS